MVSSWGISSTGVPWKSEFYVVAWGPKVKVPRENHDKVLSPFMSQPQRYYGPAMICYRTYTLLHFFGWGEGRKWKGSRNSRRCKYCSHLCKIQSATLRIKKHAISMGYFLVYQQSPVGHFWCNLFWPPQSKFSTWLSLFLPIVDPLTLKLKEPKVS